MYFPSRILLILLVFCLSAGKVLAYHNSHHTEDDEDKHYTSARQQTDQDLVEYNKQILQAYNKYKEKVTQVWGEASVIPDAKTDVTYREQMKQRSVVDFEKGSVSVEIAINTDDEAVALDIEERLAAAIEKTILEPSDERSIIEIAEDPEPPKTDNPPALQDLVADEDGKPLQLAGINAFKKHTSSRSKRRFILGRDGKKRVLITTQFHLVPNHIRVRAEKFRDLIDRNAALHRIPAPLIFAIIETESMFNPHAKSPVPAFGLMQLVPETGARDAYKYLYRKDRVVKESYLYEPKNNVELGAAYLHLLYFRHFKHIKDHDARQWATIAAYNAGAINVFKSFAGEYTRANYPSLWSWKSNALKQINSMKPEQVYNFLRQYLPAEETRDYLQKVRERMDKYNI